MSTTTTDSHKADQWPFPKHRYLSQLVVAIIHNAKHIFVLYISNETHDQININEALVKQQDDIEAQGIRLPMILQCSAVSKMPVQGNSPQITVCLVKLLGNTYLRLRLKNGKTYTIF